MGLFLLALLSGGVVYVVRQEMIDLQPNFQALTPYALTLFLVHGLCFVFLVKRPSHLIENTVVVTLIALSTATLASIIISFFLRQTYSLFLMVPFVIVLWTSVITTEIHQRTKITRLRFALIDSGRWAGAEFPTIDLVRVTSPAELDNHNFDVLLIDDHIKQQDVWRNFFLNSHSRIPLIDAREFYELVSGHVWPASLFPDYSKIVRPTLYSEFLKRCSDVVIAAVALVVMLPAFFVLIPIVMLSSPGGIFFRQQRVGRNGEIFVLHKVRTMFLDSEVDGPRFAAHQDRRVTSIGRFLRRTRLDEWPQFINVLKGEMSIIGPRPERPEWVEEFRREIPLYDLRHAVRPGITGWAQVNTGYGVGKAGAEKKLNYDLYYLEHLGIAIDVIVTYRTLATLIRGQGAR